MASKEPQARYRHAAVCVGQKLYIWGGYGRAAAKIDTTAVERFDVLSGTWLQPDRLRGSLPDQLGGMAVATDGVTAYTFGGRTGSHPNHTYYDTIHKINPSTLECEELVPTNPSQAPKQKYGNGMVYFNQKLVVHGGQTGKDRTAELRVFDLKTNTWSDQPATGEKPPPVSSHTFTKINHHRAVVFGGFTGRSELNDTYVLDMETWHWTKLKVTGVKPPARYSHATCCIAGPLTRQQHPLLMVIGGWSNTEKTFSDAWLLDVDKETWSQVSLPKATSHRHDPSATVFGGGPDFRLVVLFGGFAYGRGHLSETTLLCLELKEGSWQVTRVVRPDEIGRPDEMLKEQMRKLELSPQSNAGFKKGAVIDMKEIQMGKRLGQGGFGDVYEAKWKKKTVAVKVCLGNLVQNYSREIEILTSLPPHPNVLIFFGVALSSDGVSTSIITELAPNGSLHDYLHVKKEEPSPDQSFAWALQVASGMQHLHNNNVVHRDLKSGNILLSFGLLAKICDFGAARSLSKTSMTSQKGTYRWMAPEVVEDVEANINKMCDVFSYGMVLYEIFSHEIPYADLPNNARVGMAVLQGKRPPIPPTLPPFLHPLLEACWKENPNHRPQFETIVMAIHTGSFE